MCVCVCSYSRTCAKKLKSGVAVYPEVYQEATVFFSDIVGFTDITANSSPTQIVELLNDVSHCFDEVICNYDAYKVNSYQYLSFTIVKYNVFVKAHHNLGYN